VLRQLLQSKRPIEYDIRMKPITDLAADSFGYVRNREMRVVVMFVLRSFPSLETHMCIVIMFDLYFLSHRKVILAAAVLLTGIVGFSRIVARSRFPHQIVGSVGSGFLGLSLGYQYCTKMSFHSMASHNHGVYVALVVGSVVCYFALASESNDSRLMNVPKSEFIRVLRGIAFPDQQAQEGQQHFPARTGVDGSPRSPKSPLQKISTPRSLAIKQAISTASKLSATARLRGNTRAASKDSFFYLQRTLEKREEEKKAFARQLELSNANAFGDAVNNSFFHRIARAGESSGFSSSDSEYVAGGRAT
jgi:hypothetical protein